MWKRRTWLVLVLMVVLMLWLPNYVAQQLEGHNVQMFASFVVGCLIGFIGANAVFASELLD